MDDQEFTCNTLVKKMEDGELLTTKDKLRLQTAKYITKPDGSYKKYINPEIYYTLLMKNH